MKCDACGVDGEPAPADVRFRPGEFVKDREITLQHLEVFTCACGQAEIFRRLAELMRLIELYPEETCFCWDAQRLHWWAGRCDSARRRYATPEEFQRVADDVFRKHRELMNKLSDG